MRCPLCMAEETRVIETRANDDQGTIRRRRECQHCHRRFTTYERYEEPPLYVIKKDGRREPFSRAKLMDGITISCGKRPVSRQAIEEIVNSIERSLRDALRDEVASSVLGDMTMRRLHDLDEVAYVRFASVYKEFHDSNSFVNEIERMRKRSRTERLAEEQRALFDA